VAISSATGSQNSLLNAGDVVSVTATFSESVIVASGTPTLTLVVGSTNRTATYASGSGSTSLVFQYTIQAGETDSDGISIGANALALNSGTIRDAAGNNATLTHISVADNSSYMVDTTAPKLISISPANGSDNVSVVSTTGFEFGFNEEINSSTILTNSNTTSCDGYSATIQTSPDNFSTNTNCLQLGTPTTSDNMNFSIIRINLINSLCPTFYSSTCGSNLMPGTNYQIKVTSQVKDLAGNALNGGTDNLSNFISKARPYVSSTSPDNGSNDVRDNETIVLHFSNAMTSASLDNTTVTISPSLTGGLSVNYDNASDNLSISAVSGFDNTTYTITIADNTTYGADEKIFLSPDYSFTFTSISGLVDIDGNVYSTVVIGDQHWMAENLKVTKYRNGDNITNITNNSLWGSDTSGAYGVYDNNASNLDSYGRLYNWYAVDNSSGRYICPEGWHVPSTDEYDDLEDEVGNGGAAGGKLKEPGIEYWQSPNTGADNETSSGFNARGNGYRLRTNGVYTSIKQYSYTWTSSTVSNKGYYRYQSYKNNLSGSGTTYKTHGFSVRCLED